MQLMALMFIGLSMANMMTKEMLLSMAKNPIVFAILILQISYTLAKEPEDIIIATGSDHQTKLIMF